MVHETLWRIEGVKRKNFEGGGLSSELEIGSEVKCSDVNGGVPQAIDPSQRVIIIVDVTVVVQNGLIGKINPNGGGAKKSRAIIPATNESKKHALFRTKKSKPDGEGMVIRSWHIGFKGGIRYGAI